MNGLGAMGLTLLFFLVTGALFILSEIFLGMRIVSLLIPFVTSVPVFLIFFRKAVRNATNQYNSYCSNLFSKEVCSEYENRTCT